MNRITTCLVLVASLGTAVLAAPPPAEAGLTNGVLLIAQSATAVTGGRATLIIGPLRRTGQIYSGDYQMKVAPFFFKGENGRLAIVVSNEALVRVSRGLGVEITGTATTGGKGGATRRIDAVARPAGSNDGDLRLWFVAGDRKLVFDTQYRFVEKQEVRAGGPSASPRAVVNPEPNRFR